MRKKRLKALRDRFTKLVGRPPEGMRIVPVPDLAVVAYIPSEIRRLKKGRYEL